MTAQLFLISVSVSCFGSVFFFLTLFAIGARHSRESYMENIVLAGVICMIPIFIGIWTLAVSYQL